jgi:TolB-like protein/cytochrome c-type biogenesis protein CcmH/NrfG
MSFISELKRRNVFRVATAYVVGSWLIIQVAETTFPAFGLGDTALRVVIIVLGVAFIPALVFSWAFELTPEGLRREVDVAREASITRYTGKRIDRIIMVLLAVALGYFLFDRLVLTPAREAAIVEQARQEGAERAREEALLQRSADKSVAVLPFVNRGGQSEDDYFADGIHDEVLTRVGGISTLRVISRTSVMRYRDTDKPLPEIARELSVATIMEGSVQRAGSQVRITTRLINAHTDELLWSASFDRELTAENLFAIQREIAVNIADSLGAELSPRQEERLFDLPTASLEAYDLYLRGRVLMATRLSDELRQALSAFQRAVEIDPEFAQAWVGVADASARLRDSGFHDWADVTEIMQPAVETALRLDDQLGEAYASLAMLNWYKDDREAAEAAFQEAIRLSPNYEMAYMWYANFLDADNPQKELNLLLKAAELNPHSSVIRFNIAGRLGNIEGLDVALEHYERLLQTDPDFAPTYGNVAEIHQYRGRLAEAVSWYRKARQLDPESAGYLVGLAHLYLAVGEYDALAGIQQDMERYLGPEAWNTGATSFLTVLDRSGWREALHWLDENVSPERASLPAVLETRALVHLIGRNAQEAFELWMQSQPGWLDTDNWQHLISGQRDGCLTAGLFISAGKTVLGRALLSQSLEFVEGESRGRYKGIDRSAGPGLCYLLNGSYDRAFAFFDQYVEQAHFANYFWIFVRQLPWWDPVRSHPRYVAMMSRIEEIKAEQRELIRRLDEPTDAGG